MHVEETKGLTDADVHRAVGLLTSEWHDKEAACASMRGTNFANVNEYNVEGTQPTMVTLQCDECRLLLEDFEAAQMHMDNTEGEHCMFTEVNSEQSPTKTDEQEWSCSPSRTCSPEQPIHSFIE